MNAQYMYISIISIQPNFLAFLFSFLFSFFTFCNGPQWQTNTRVLHCMLFLQNIFLLMFLLWLLLTVRHHSNGIKMFIVHLLSFSESKRKEKRERIEKRKKREKNCVVVNIQGKCESMAEWSRFFSNSIKKTAARRQFKHKYM